ncbi:hypothetical protein D3C85_1316120 [compost metagenome]
MKVPCTINGATVLGTRWRIISTCVGVPSEMAASTYGSSRRLRISPRTRRTTRGNSGTAMAISTVSMLAPVTATRAMASRMLGTDMMPSMIRMMTMSAARK